MDSQEENNLPTLFCEDVVWDAALFNTVQRMKPDECRAVAKWSAYSLRRDSPSYFSAFRELEGTQQVLASTDVRLQVLAAKYEDDKGEVEGAEGNDQSTDLLERRRVTTDAKLKDIYRNINDYRRASGYRSLAILTLGAEHGHSKKTIASANAMRILNKGQSSHLESMLLVAKLQAYQKLDPVSLNETLREEVKSLHNLLECHTAKAAQVIKGLNINIAGREIQEMHREFLSKCPTVSDPVLTAINEAFCAIQVFRAANRSLTHNLSEAINQLNEEHFPAGQIFPDAA